MSDSTLTTPERDSQTTIFLSQDTKELPKIHLKIEDGVLGVPLGDDATDSTIGWESHYLLEGIDAKDIAFHVGKFMRGHDGTAFIQPINDSLWHVQCAWPYSDTSPDGMQYVYGLRWFTVRMDVKPKPFYYKATSIPSGDELTDFILLVVLERAQNERCALRVFYPIQAGRCLYDEFKRAMGILYPQIDKGVREPTSDTQPANDIVITPPPAQCTISAIAPTLKFSKTSVLEEFEDGKIVSEVTITAAVYHDNDEELIEQKLKAAKAGVRNTPASGSTDSSTDSRPSTSSAIGETVDQKKRRDAIAKIQSVAWHTRYQLVQQLKEEYGIDTSESTVKDDMKARGISKPTTKKRVAKK